MSVRTIAVVVAHPDDEVLGVGGQLIRWSEASVSIVSATNGAPPDDADAHAAGFADGRAYAAARRRELGAALAWLPRPPKVIALGGTDQRVTHELPDLVAMLDRVLASEEPDAVITHPYEGGHPDHDALAVALALLTGAARPPRFIHLEFAGYFERQDGTLAIGEFPDEPVADAVRLPLSGAEQRLKRLMLRCFTSQQRTLAPFMNPVAEWLRIAPAYEFTRAPNGGRVWYDRFPLGMRSEEWRRLIERHLAGPLAARAPC